VKKKIAINPSTISISINVNAPARSLLRPLVVVAFMAFKR
jgi:hypothetical protein